MSTRRDFARLAITAAALPLLPAAAQTPPPAGTPAPPPPPGDEAKVSQYAQAQIAVITALYGDHLNAEEIARISKDLHESAPYVERLRAFELTNADEPDMNFVAGRP
jgi:hypothetical protein